ncbi:MAG TPA: ATP-binding protein [Acidobacteriaceae bacterium]
MRLKTKLVVTITGLVFVLVSALSWVYLTRSLQQNVDQNYLATDIVAHQVLFATRQAIEAGVRDHSIDPASNAPQMRAEISEVLREDAALSALMDSVISYSPTVYDITVADHWNGILLSTDPAQHDRTLRYRPLYATLRFRSPIKFLQVVTGRPRVYDVPLVLERNGQPFATVHVGVRTTFLLQAYKPWLRDALSYTGLAILTSLIVAAFVANLALNPLEQISRRLDTLSHDKSEDFSPGPVRDHDAVLQVSNKIERIGQRMRNVEEVFSALKENLDQILSNLQDGMMLFTRDSRVVLVSSSVERFLGADRDALLGASVAEVFDRETVLGRMVRDAFDRGVSIPQAEIETETGRRLGIALEMIQQAPKGQAKAHEALGALLTMHDLESVREIEDELELSHRLAAIGRLTSGVGHEVKNPINAIVVHLELMRTKLSGDEAPAMRHLNVIQSEIQRLDRVVQTLVDFSRPVEPKLQEQDLRSVVGSVLQLASAELATHAVEVVSRLPEKPLLVKVDTDMLRQALLNIVLNGAQAMPFGGKLALELTDDGRFAVLAVRDQGEGIAPEVLPRIFDLYFTTKKDGSGIGLAMTYRVVQLHSGVVEVESEVGRGTVFTIRIPCTHCGEARNRAGGAEGAAMRGGAIGDPVQGVSLR